jgi:hypothetical protein
MNMVWCSEGATVMVLHTLRAPTDHEWEGLMRLLRTIPADDLRMLAFTDGGVPDPAQRGSFIDYLESGKAVISVISTSVQVRAAVTAISRFSAAIMHFEPSLEGFEEAVKHLGLDPELAGRMLARMRNLSADLDGGCPVSLP